MGSGGGPDSGGEMNREIYITLGRDSIYTKVSALCKRPSGQLLHVHRESHRFIAHAH